MKRIFLFLYVLVFPVVAHAELITYNYQGRPMGVPFGDLFRNGVDFIFGSALIDFNGPGTYTAISWTIGATSAVGPITVSNDTLGIVQSRAEFTFTEMPNTVFGDIGPINAWNFHALGNFYGSDFNDLLSTLVAGGFAEDIASIDWEIGPSFPCFRGACGHTITHPGVWTVPEPSSLALMLVGIVGCAAVALKKKRPAPRARV